MDATVGEATRRVDQVVREGHTKLDLSGLRLAELPKALAELTDLTELNLDHNRLETLPDWLGDLTRLTTLRLDRNRLTELPGCVTNLTGLTRLDLDRNRLTVLPRQLARLIELSTLYLDANRFTELPDWIGSMASLKQLYFGRNPLRTLPAWLHGMSGLVELSVDECRLSAVPDWLADLTCLTEVDLRKNRLLTLPESLAALTNLTFLDVSGNRLTALPDSFAALTNLATLDIGDNSLISIPGWLATLNGFTELGIAGCRLTSIPDWIAGQTELVRLDASDNQLTALPNWMTGLTSLKCLDLETNRLSALPNWLSELPGLMELDVSGNDLVALPDCLSRMTSLTRLDLSWNNLTSLPDLGNLTKLELLRLQGCKLAELPGWLSNLTQLTTLSIADNQIADLPDWLRRLTKLSNLNVSDNQLKAVPDCVPRLTELQYLYFNNNQLEALPDSMGDLANLEILTVSNNRIGTLPDWVADLTGINSLRLDNNRLTILPDRLADLTSLEVLGISGNRLAVLPDWLGNFTALTWLDLSHCQLTKLPEWLANLTSITELYVNDNELATLPEVLAGLTTLTKLRLSNNKLTALPNWLANLTDLTHLHADHNHLTAMPHWLTDLTDLTFLDLDRNQVSEWPDRFAEVAGLTFLRLSNNKLTGLVDDVVDLVRLTGLFLQGNHLTTLPDGIENLARLTNLNVSENELTVLPEGIADLTGLTYLSLQNNKLTTLPGRLAGLPELKQLKVHGNPLVSPPPEITAGGSQSVLAFLKAREQGSSLQWESKLLVVGEGGVGKTSLVKSIAGESHDPDEPTTHGLKIKDLLFEHPSMAGVQMRLSAWDFGGQQIYHATHQFFLTNQSLFLLVWNSRLGWEQGKLRYWLDIITARAPQSPIMLVATHIGDRPVDLPLAELCKEYPKIVGNMAVDNDTRHGLNALRTGLAELAAGLPLMGSEWPKTWLAAAESLRSAPDRHVTPERVWQMMSTAGVTDRVQQHYIAVALHHLGDILYYDDDPELAETVVLQPEWVNDYISKVLDSHQVADAQGLLTRDHLNELWCDLDRGLRDHFLGMMDKYDLSYRIEGGRSGDVSLVVERLPWDAPSYQDAWDATRSLPDTHEIRVLYRLNTMPPGIPTWFIARSHRFSTKTHWRTGAVLRHTDDRHVALVRADQYRNTVELTVRGPSPAAFFSVLDDGLNMTLERFPGLDITRQVPCPCQDSQNDLCAELFNYEDLRSRLARNPPKERIECHKSGELVAVPQLLLGFTPSERETTGVGVEQITKMLMQIDGKLDKLSEQTEYTQRRFLKVLRIAQLQQEARCPSVFALVPTSRKRLTGSAYELRLYCEEPGAWHRLPEPDGCYSITEPADWLRTFGPYLRHLLAMLRHAAPLAAPILGMTVDKLDTHLKADCDLMKELVSQVPSQLNYNDELRGMDPTGPDPSARATKDADFRVLESMLVKLDPDRVWGGLSRTTTPEGLTLYLCRDHLAAYREAVQS